MNRTLTLFRNFISKKAKLAIIFPPSVQEVFTGMLLGDGHITKPSTTNQSRFAVRQNNFELVQLLWDLLKPLGIVGALPHTDNYHDKRTDKTYTPPGG